MKGSTKPKSTANYFPYASKVALVLKTFWQCNVQANKVAHCPAFCLNLDPFLHDAAAVPWMPPGSAASQQRCLQWWRRWADGTTPPAAPPQVPHTRWGDRCGGRWRVAWGALPGCCSKAGWSNDAQELPCGCGSSEQMHTLIDQCRSDFSWKQSEIYIFNAGGTCNFYDCFKLFATSSFLVNSTADA